MKLFEKLDHGGWTEFNLVLFFFFFYVDLRRETEIGRNWNKMFESSEGT